MSKLEITSNNDNFNNSVEELIKIFPSEEDFKSMFHVYEELNKRFDAGATLIKVYGSSMFCVYEKPSTEKEYINYTRERKTANVSGITFEYNELIARCPDCGEELITSELLQFNINSIYNRYYAITGQDNTQSEKIINLDQVVRKRKE